MSSRIGGWACPGRSGAVHLARATAVVCSEWFARTLLRDGDRCSLLAAPASASAAVTVSPLAGTPDAMPATQISVLGTPASNIASVTVTGSVSGVHSGQLQAYSSAQGASFLPDSAFEEGEEVDAVVALKEGGTIEDHFTIAHLAPARETARTRRRKTRRARTLQDRAGTASAEGPGQPRRPEPRGRLLPRPAALADDPRRLETARIRTGRARGPDAARPRGPPGVVAPVPPGRGRSGLRPVTYEGKPAVAWWQGVVTETANGEGEGVIAEHGLRTDRPRQSRQRPSGGHPRAADRARRNRLAGRLRDASASPSATNRTSRSWTAPSRRSTSSTGLVMWEWSAMAHVAESAIRSRCRPTASSIPTTSTRSQPLPGRQGAGLDARHLGRLHARPGHAAPSSGRSPARAARSRAARARTSTSSTTRGWKARR